MKYIKVITIISLIMVTNAKAQDGTHEKAQDTGHSIVELEKKDQHKDNSQHHIAGLEEECKKIDWYYELIGDELMAGRRINWRFLHNTGLFKYIYEETENLDPEIKEKLVPYNKFRVEQVIKTAIQHKIGAHDFDAFQNEIDILSCRFQNKPECFEVWDTLVARYAPKIQDATSSL